MVKNLPANAGDAEDVGLIPGLERSLREGKGYPLQYSGLENSLDCIVHGVAKNQTRPSGLLTYLLMLEAGDTVRIPKVQGWRHS